MKIFYEKYFQLFSCSRPVNCHRCVLSPLPQTPNYCDIFINTRISMNPQMKRERNKLEHGNNALILTPSCRWVDISTWTPTPQGCLYLKARHLSLNLHNLDIFHALYIKTFDIFCKTTVKVRLIRLMAKDLSL